MPAAALPLRLVLCTLACAAGLLLLSHATADAKRRRPARRGHHSAHRHRRHLHRRPRLSAIERLRRDRVVTLAWRAVGRPYRWGGASPRGGFDCSGLTQWVYGQLGVRLPHYTVAQWRYGRRVSRRALLPGDLLFFSGLGHVGIYLGHGALIHAPRPGARVQLARFRGWFASSFYGARRLRLAG